MPETWIPGEVYMVHPSNYPWYIMVLHERLVLVIWDPLFPKVAGTLRKVKPEIEEDAVCLDFMGREQL